MCICVPHVCLVPVSQKRTLDLLELELKMTVNHHMGAGN